MIPVLIPRLGISKFWFRDRFRVLHSPNIDSETNSETRLEPSLGVSVPGRENREPLVENGYKCNVHSKNVLHKFYVCIGFQNKGFGMALNLYVALKKRHAFYNSTQQKAQKRSKLSYDSLLLLF